MVFFLLLQFFGLNIHIKAKKLDLALLKLNFTFHLCFGLPMINSNSVPKYHINQCNWFTITNIIIHITTIITDTVASHHFYQTPSIIVTTIISSTFKTQYLVNNASNVIRVKKAFLPHELGKTWFLGYCAKRSFHMSWVKLKLLLASIILKNYLHWRGQTFDSLSQCIYLIMI